jgi:hypothetical protein
MVTAARRYSITASQHHNITSLQQYSTTTVLESNKEADVNIAQQHSNTRV